MAPCCIAFEVHASISKGISILRPMQASLNVWQCMMKRSMFFLSPLFNLNVFSPLYMHAYYGPKSALW